MRRHLLLVLLLAGCAVGRTLTYTDLLGQMTDLDRLTRLQPGVKSGQCSSWDRAETERWAPNGDCGQYLRVEPNGEAVMADLKGPGCVFRLWSANPQGKIRFYLDGAATPSYEFDHNELYQGKTAPFIKPLAWQREPGRASDLYFPIPYRHSLKITASEKINQYYCVNYQTYPEGWLVPTFRLPLSADEQRAVDKVARAWAAPGTDPKAPRRGAQSKRLTIELPPGQTARLAELAGPGEIRALRIKVDCEQRDWPRKLVLQGTWDAAPWPQVLSPMGAFFGFDWQAPEYGALPMGCLGGESYCFFTMPFGKSASLRLTSHLARPALITYEVLWAPQPMADDSCYFYARWRHARNATTFDWPFVETAGHGTLVGTSLQINHPTPGWWGEGDEKVWADDEDQFPPWIGTGSEDYFGDAWGIRYLPGPSWGCSRQEGNQTCCYRWHLLDNIPFAKRLRMTIENYGPNGQWGGPSEYEYNSVGYWYQQELVPPFEQLRDRTYIGGVKPGDKPSPQAYNPDLFRAPSEDDLHCLGLAEPGCVEAETLLKPAVDAGRARIISDVDRPRPFNVEQAVDFGTVKAGDVLGEFGLDVPADGVYQPTVVVGEETTARLCLSTPDTTPASDEARPQPWLRVLPPVLLTKGSASLRLTALTAGLAVVDAVRLAPVPRELDAMEAEDQTVVASTGGGEAPRPSQPMLGPSGGRILEWHGDLGASLTLRLAKPAEEAYVLGVKPMRGPGAGVLQAFVGGKAIGPRFDLYAPEKGVGPAVLPLGMVPRGCAEVELRLVDRNPAATSVHCGLDYFRWEPKILHPDSAPGLVATVTGLHACQYRIQNLGDRFIGNHHLWLQPCDNNAVLEIALDVPETRVYKLALRLTTSWDYAKVQPSLDNKDLGEPVDCYTLTVEQTPEVDLGSHELTAGRHYVKLKAAGHNAKSAGYLMGLDYLSVK